MQKIIAEVRPTKEVHPAVGRVFSIIFKDGTQEFLYEETFYHQIANYSGDKSSFLVGKVLNTGSGYFKMDL